MNTLRGTQTLNSLISLQNLSSQKTQSPPVNLPKIQKEKGKEKEVKSGVKNKSQKKTNSIDQSETCENVLIAAAIAEKNDIRNNVYNGITINLDFTKNGQYPLVEFKM